ncbi:MAG: mannose-1-phosphate guanylyltransferase [Brooklawnia sp.]|jgi:mannose-1-phosphate guanylyltransferase
MRYVVIMAGGSGKRLWPLSRQGQPKQLLRLFDGRSLLQLAHDRVRQVVPEANILVCTGAAYADVVAEQLPGLPAQNLLGEPEGRDSLNAVAWPAAVLARHDPDAVMAVVSADQLIRPVASFIDALEAGFRLATDDPNVLVTFGVPPTSPHTGYGYLERGEDLPGYGVASRINEFKEKPDTGTAEAYLASGRYWWNAGMFVWRAQTLLDQLAVLLPDTHSQVCQLAEHPERLAEIYPGLVRISVDYAVMEPVSRGKGSAHIAGIELAIQWADVGSYESLYEVLDRDSTGNAVIGTVLTSDATGNLLINTDPGSVLGVVGLHDAVVVRTANATLAGPLSASQQVRGLADRVASEISVELA